MAFSLCAGDRITTRGWTYHKSQSGSVRSPKGGVKRLELGGPGPSSLGPLLPLFTERRGIEILGSCKFVSNGVLGSFGQEFTGNSSALDSVVGLINFRRA